MKVSLESVRSSSPFKKYEFGSGITIEGSFYFEAERRPVALYGTMSGAKVRLCEISGDAELNRIVVQGSKTPFETATCPISLTLGDEAATGTWKRDGVEYPVALRKIASLDDTGEAQIDGNVVIPFWAQTKTHMFAGTYAGTSAGICMQKVEIINKGNGKVDQDIAFGDDNCNAGMLMTPIYMNVEKWIDAGAEIISINFRDSRAGYSENYVYDKTSRKYVERK